MITWKELIDNDTLLKYMVTYECIKTLPMKGMEGTNSRLCFDQYDIKAFVSAAPENWEIRTIEQYQVPNR